MTPRHPMQPIVNVDGVTRFKANKIVQFLFTNSQFVNDDTLAAMNFASEDREQFAQLLGCRVSGYVELPYVSLRSSHEAQIAEDKLSPANPYAHELSLVDETDVSCAPIAEQVKT